MLHKKLSGRDLHEPTNIWVENQTGVTIPALTVVSLNGKGVVYPKIILANPNIQINFGVTYDNIQHNKSGQVCAFGIMRDIDTSAWTAGTLLYSDNSGNLTTSVNGGVVAEVIYQHSEHGMLYVITEPDNTTVNSWYLSGNSGTNPATHFVGTTDNNPLIFKTNNIEAARISNTSKFGLGTDPKSHFHQKSHVGFPESGLRQETLSLITNSTSYENIYTVSLPNQCVCRLEIVVIGRTSDGLNRCIFKRTGLFYREFSNVSIQNNWISNEDIKSNVNLNIGYNLGISDLDIRVKSSTSGLTYWTGHVKVEILTTN